jgi:hypothetical protein
MCVTGRLPIKYRGADNCPLNRKERRQCDLRHRIRQAENLGVGIHPEWIVFGRRPNHNRQACNGLGIRKHHEIGTATPSIYFAVPRMPNISKSLSTKTGQPHFEGKWKKVRFIRFCSVFMGAAKAELARRRIGDEGAAGNTPARVIYWF